MNSFSTERFGKSTESEFRKRWHASSAPVDAWVALLTRHSAGKKMPVIAWKMLFLLPACSHGSCCSPWGWVALASSKNLH